MSKKAYWLFNQSAVIPYIALSGEVYIVLITSSAKNGWVIPRGVIERGMTAEESAQKEAWEEAGVKGAVSNGLIAEYEYEKWGGTCSVKVFPLKVSEVLDTWEEDGLRERSFVPISEAIGLVKPVLRSSLVSFKEKYSSFEDGQ